MRYNPTGNARKIVAALNGAPDGDGWVCRCPAHADTNPSLRVVDRGGKTLVCCRAGCTQSEVITALKKLRLWKSWGRGVARRQQQDDKPAPAQEPPPRDPLKTWRRAYPNVRGTQVETYLGRRSIVLTDAEAASLRFASGLFHWPTRTRWPAMIALVKLADGTELAGHQTFLALDGSAKRRSTAQVVPRRRRSRIGGAVWFGAPRPDQEFLVGEGIESTLEQHAPRPALRPGCAALSTLGIRRLILPAAAKRVRIFADRDNESQGFNAARVAWQRWRAEGREVRITLARASRRGRELTFSIRRCGHERPSLKPSRRCRLCRRCRHKIAAIP